MDVDITSLLPLTTRSDVQTYTALSSSENLWMTNLCSLLVTSNVWYVLIDGSTSLLTSMAVPEREVQLRPPEPEQLTSTNWLFRTRRKVEPSGMGGVAVSWRRAGEGKGEGEVRVC